MAGCHDIDIKMGPCVSVWEVVVTASCTAFYTDVYKMASLLCQCGDEFRAQCDEHASSFSFAWVLLLAYVVLHMMYVCTHDDSDDDECESTMYS